MRIKRWTMVDAATGRVIRTASASNKHDIPAPPAGQIRFDGERLKGDEVWLRDGKPEPRPKLDLPKTLEPGVGERVELDVPPGTKIYRNEVPIGTAEGKVEFAPRAAGTTIIRVEPPFPYQPATVTIVAGREAIERARADAMAARVTAAREGFAGLD